MPKFRKKPVVIEAKRFTGFNWEEIYNWIESDSGSGGPNGIVIETLEGKMKADVGDWIIRGVKGEFYPCKDDVFQDTYEQVE